MFFQGAFDCHAPGHRDIINKLRNNEKMKFLKIEFSKIENSVRIDAPMLFLEAATPGTPPKYTTNPIFFQFSKIAIFMFCIDLYRKGPRGTKAFF